MRTATRIPPGWVEAEDPAYMRPARGGPWKPVDGEAAPVGRLAEPSWPTLPVEALHGLPGTVVRTLEPFTEADPAALLVDFLVSFGNAVGPGPCAIADGAEHPARLFAVTVGSTAKARKGTARRRIHQVLERADETWANERVMGGLASGEGLIAAVADGEAGPSDRRLLAFEPEFVRTLAVASRDGSTLSPIIRQAWDSGELRVMTRKVPLAATGAHVSILAHTTQDELGRRLTEVEIANGFANRFLFVAVRRSKLLPSGPDVPEKDLSRLSRLTRKALVAARRVGVVRRSPEAEELWRQLYEEVAAADDGGLVGAVTARADAQLLRLAVAFALTDGSEVVHVAHLEAARAVWGYCDASARLLFGGSIGGEVEDRLLRAIRAAGPSGLAANEQRRLFSGHVASSRLDDARRLLERRGLVRTERHDTGGRPRLVSFACAESAESAERGGA